MNRYVNWKFEEARRRGGEDLIKYSNLQILISECNPLNLKLGKLLTVAVFLTIAFAAFLFEDDYFVALHMAQHTGLDERAADVWDANSEIAVILDEMHGVERDSVSFLSCQPVDEDLLTFLNFELLTGNGNDCEHIK